MRSGPIIVAPLVERSKSSFSVSREMSTLNFLHFNPTIKLSGWGIKNLDKSASFGFGKTFKLFANEELPRRPLGMKDMTPCHWSNFPPRFTIDFLTLLPLSLSTSPYWIFCHLTLFLVIDNKLIFLLLFYGLSPHFLISFLVFAESFFGINLSILLITFLPFPPLSPWVIFHLTFCALHGFIQLDPWVTIIAVYKQSPQKAIDTVSPPSAQWAFC